MRDQAPVLASAEGRGFAPLGRLCTTPGAGSPAAGNAGAAAGDIADPALALARVQAERAVGEQPADAAGAGPHRAIRRNPAASVEGRERNTPAVAAPLELRALKATVGRNAGAAGDERRAAEAGITGLASEAARAGLLRAVAPVAGSNEAVRRKDVAGEAVGAIGVAAATPVDPERELAALLVTGERQAADRRAHRAALVRARERAALRAITGARAAEGTVLGETA